MNSGCVLFVEGENDKSFVEIFLKRMGLSNFQVEVMGGGVSKLRQAQIRIQRVRNRGMRVAVILDANSDVTDRRSEFESKNRELDLRVERLFLFPDDENPGDLESLLEEIAASRHKAIHDCFSTYIDCLKALPENYRLPDSKARIFAYCEALGNGPKEADRDYGETDHWDMDAPALRPLKNFLWECAQADPIGGTG